MGAGTSCACAQQCCEQAAQSDAGAKVLAVLPVYVGSLPAMQDKESQRIAEAFPGLREGDSYMHFGSSKEDAAVDIQSDSLPALHSPPAISPLMDDHLDALESREPTVTSGFDDFQGVGGPRAAPREQPVSRSSKHQVDTDYEDEEDDGDSASGSYFRQELHELARLPVGEIGRKERRSPYLFESGAVYAGEWVGNQRHGFGRQQWEDGAMYEGQWHENCAQGRGRFVHSDGGTYIGEWQANLAHGMGVYYHTEELTSYHGEWRNDLQHGYGVEVWGEGTQYEGQFVRGNKEGSGVYHWPDKSQYRGSWEGNAINGMGEFFSNDGRCFMGSWQDSVIHGLGSYRWPNGQEYRGQYLTDSKHGFGVFVWPDGRKYEGFWDGGKQHGEGRIQLPDGTSKVTRWHYGTRDMNPI
mmetsp:Transcript_101656/g.282957  ORF Transcript_101656/g.282957 Transcript_101656/m.282957 type:complete len:411 (+) Transcript_101656:176-1408(+)|eukprot:CAMPEP_0179059990 /NCGR_PEP_ID=MMETSP0796-20121207/25636_1 /TAXON_ID=73915 /ORGANISM="Pyrodinium bahamense, Strain pbaha01" /LENGTH=410 /DNA_ID=CAMNT_0020756761 /DNA_START=168 /DNA_END=1400 /DNA_ORIENTATION=-